MLRKYYGLLLLLICLVISVLFIFKNNLSNYFVEESGSIQKEIKKSKMVVEQKIQGVYLVDTQENNTNWELWAESALSNSKTSDWRFNTVNVKFYNKDRSVYDVTAEVASVNLKKKEMALEGLVKIKSPNGYLMKAKNLFYDFKKKLIYSKDPVEIKSNNPKVREPIHFDSSQFSADLGTSIISLRDVSSSRSVKNKKITITSSAAQLFGNSFKIRYKNNVKFIGYGFVLKSNVMDFIISKRRQLLKEILAKGNVRIVSGARKINSDRAHMDVNSEVITLTGKPKFKQLDDILLGEKIVFYNKTKSVSVKRPRAKVDKLGLESYNEPVKGR